MTTFRRHITDRLRGIYSTTEIRHLYYILVENVTGLSKERLLAQSNSVFSARETDRLHAFVERLQQHEPIQHIVGECRFCNLLFEVNNAVLIPRPETEELVAWITQDNNRWREVATRADSPKILDIGTGSGCIAVSLKSALPHARVEACDISPKAVATARCNAKRHAAEVEIRVEDVFAASFREKENADYDIIVSNPPYICHSEKEAMQPNVLDHEPHAALFVPNEKPLLFYEAIADFARKNLTANGNLYFEINRAYGKETVAMLKEKGFGKVALRQDLSGNDRMIKANFL